jgi:hypothetical protein
MSNEVFKKEIEMTVRQFAEWNKVRKAKLTAEEEYNRIAGQEYYNKLKEEQNNDDTKQTD